MLTQVSKTGRAMKCVYMAPTKALCSERYHDWTTKFDALGIKCNLSTIICVICVIQHCCSGCELTGDTVLFGKGAWGDAKTATIM